MINGIVCLVGIVLIVIAFYFGGKGDMILVGIIGLTAFIAGLYRMLKYPTE